MGTLIIDAWHEAPPLPDESVTLAEVLFGGPLGTHLMDQGCCLWKMADGSVTVVDPSHERRQHFQQIKRQAEM